MAGNLSILLRQNMRMPSVCGILARCLRAPHDCGKAGTTIEKQICASPSLSSLDVKLTETYKELQPFVDKKGLRSEQVAWMKTRNRCTDSACLQQAYEERLGELEAHLVRQQRAAAETFSR
ncbi:MAG: DUF1311 domain-containing protein [Actinobacteria bacterium]|nr:MAG: DUF1311 domain-containing protein [Actinomycetota bacterium]